LNFLFSKTLVDDTPTLEGGGGKLGGAPLGAGGKLGGAIDFCFSANFVSAEINKSANDSIY
jgi:hypothetical protein